MKIKYYNDNDLKVKYFDEDTPEKIKNNLDWLANGDEILPVHLWSIMNYYKNSEIVEVIPAISGNVDYVILFITIDGVGYCCEYGNHGIFIKFNMGEVHGTSVKKRLLKYTDLFEENENE